MLFARLLSLTMLMGLLFLRLWYFLAHNYTSVRYLLAFYLCKTFQLSVNDCGFLFRDLQSCSFLLCLPLSLIGYSYNLSFYLQELEHVHQQDKHQLDQLQQTKVMINHKSIVIKSVATHEGYKYSRTSIS